METKNWFKVQHCTAFRVATRFNYSTNPGLLIKSPIRNLFLFTVICFTLLMAPMVRAEGVIQLPQTGQTKCYNASGTEIGCAGTGQDGEIRAGAAWPNPRFTVGTGAETDCIIDNLTGLMWPKNGNLPNGTKVWNDAIDYPKTLTLCGYSDWRVPNVNELESLVNASRSNQATWLNTQGFTIVQSGYYWSSTTLANDTGYAWSVSMYDGGHVVSSGKSDTGYVWPVRIGQSGSFGNSGVWQTGQTISYRAGDDGDLKQGASWSSTRFSDQGNGEVTDNLTGLVWTKGANATGPLVCSPAAQKTWQGALDFVKCLNTQNYLGNTDWRLPNRKELRSLADYSRYNTALPSGHPFTNVQSDSYWSSSAGANDTGYAWSVHLDVGGVFYGDKSVNYYVWPVRSGQTWPFYNLGIQKSGTGSGTVTSDAPGISCGSDCGESYHHDTQVTLTAAANSGFIFAGWSGDCTGTQTKCTVVMDASKNVTATFSDITAPTGTLVVNSGGSSTKAFAVTLTLSCSDTTGCAETKFSNDNINWSTPEAFKTTKSWNLLSPDETKTVYVKFKDAAGNWSTPYSDTIVLDTAAPTTTPSVTGGTYSSTQSVSLTSNEGSTIYYTTNGSTPTTSSSVYKTAIPITSKTTLKFFAVDSAGNSSSIQTETYKIEYVLTVKKTGIGAGKIISSLAGIDCGSDCSETYDANTSITLTALPDSGYAFAGWSGVCSGIQTTCIVLMDTSKNVTATFFKPLNLPKTGQTKCYNSTGAEINCAGTGQDGDIQAGVAWPNPRFTLGADAEADCITDNLTGLMWAKNANLPNGTKTWLQALDYVKALNSSSGLCGHTDWRLPNINELESLISTDQPDTAAWLESQGFTKVESGNYWSSSAQAAYTGISWIVNLWDGFIGDDYKWGNQYMWPVRSAGGGGSVPSATWKTGWTRCYGSSTAEISCAGTGQDGDLQMGIAWPSPRFTVIGESVLDLLTGLVWTKNANTPGPSQCTSLISKTWEGALDYVKCLNTEKYLGSSDWRLPDRKELMSLVDYSQNNPSLPSGHPFVYVKPDGYWSSTTYAYHKDNAWVVNIMNLYDGYMHTDSKGSLYHYVWPVRGGSDGLLEHSLLLPNGWNFISLPKQPANTAIDQVLSTILSKVRIVWGYDAQTQGWLKFKASGSNNTLTTMTSGMGYWIYIDGNALLDMSAWGGPTTTVPLYEGWNLIGYTSTDPKDITQGLGTSIDGKWIIIWGWENGQWYAKQATTSNLSVPALTIVNKGKAYWIKMKAGQTADWNQ